MHTYKIQFYNNGKEEFQKAETPHEALLKCLNQMSVCLKECKKTDRSKANVYVTFDDVHKNYYRIQTQGAAQETDQNIEIFYHGSVQEQVNPTYGKGRDKHDYGRGFYLTKSKELAKEWAVCTGNAKGYVHEVALDLTKLTIFDFDKKDVLSWLAELMRHRDAWDSAYYKKMVPVFIQKYGIDVSAYDIIKGWRADASYFRIAKLFVRNELDVSLLDEALHLGGLDIQYCLKSKRAFDSVLSCNKIETVDGSIYLPKYNKRDNATRVALDGLVASERNTLTRTFMDIVR